MAMIVVDISCMNVIGKASSVGKISNISKRPVSCILHKKSKGFIIRNREYTAKELENKSYYYRRGDITIKIGPFTPAEQALQECDPNFLSILSEEDFDKKFILTKQ